VDTTLWLVGIRGVNDDLAPKELCIRKLSSVPPWQGENHNIAIATASSAVSALMRGPRVASRSLRLCGPRLLETKTSCPAFVNKRDRVPPIIPDPIMPIFIAVAG